MSAVLLKSLVLGGLGALVLALMAWPKPELRADTGPAVTVASPSPIQRCMNMGGALEAEWEGYWGYTVRREDLRNPRRDRVRHDPPARAGVRLHRHRPSLCDFR
ncbi:MAG: hypothetical protein R3C04_01150 [Hyphomonas sp.]